MPRALQRLPLCLLAAASLSLLLGHAQAAAPPTFTPDGYRATLSRTPTPPQVEGGKVID
ncbi:MAG TPA: sulfurtransferase, partial [Pseudomonas sp.]|nr:sulfurtransferase [Pseudomonas sp.]